MSKEQEIIKYAEKIIKEKLNKSEKTEVNFGDLFKSKFSLGSTLEQEPQGNILSNVREHNPEKDLKKAYNASPRKTIKK